MKIRKKKKHMIWYNRPGTWNLVNFYFLCFCYYKFRFLSWPTIFFWPLEKTFLSIHFSSQFALCYGRLVEYQAQKCNLQSFLSKHFFAPPYNQPTSVFLSFLQLFFALLPHQNQEVVNGNGVGMPRMGQLLSEFNFKIFTLISLIAV